MNPLAHSCKRAAATGLLSLLVSCGGGGGGGGGGGPPPALNIASTTLIDGVIGALYVQTIIVTGGTGTKTMNITTGTLPAGLVFNAAIGEIRGTPTGPAGTTNLTITVTDSGTPQQTDTQALNLRIATPLIVSSGSPPLATIGVPYNHAVTASGGTPPYEYFLDLPSGLSVNGSGLISGSPLPDALTANGAGSVQDAAAPRQFTGANSRIRVAVEALTTMLPDATSGIEYGQVLQARGGDSPYNWAIVGGSLPPGISHGGGGFIGGNAVGFCSPTTSTFDARVTDTDVPTQSDTQTGITITVFKGPLSLQALGLPVARVDEPYETTQVRGSLGVPPYAFAVTAGALPGGLNMIAATGQIVGTPDTAGAFTFTVRITDSCGTTAFRDYTLTVGGPAQGRNDSIPTATVIGNGVFFASISPSGHPNTVFDPDEDYYSITTSAASTITFDLNGQSGEIDTVIEIVNAGGVRLSSCGPPAFTSTCVNDDEIPGFELDSFLQVQVGGPTTIYLRVVEWRGDARPDLQYVIQVSGVN